MFEIWYRFCEVLVVSLTLYSFVGWMFGLMILDDYTSNGMYIRSTFRHKLYYAFGLFSILVTVVPSIVFAVWLVVSVIRYIIFGI